MMMNLCRVKQSLAFAALLLAGASCDLVSSEDDTGAKLPQITSRLSVGEATTCTLSSGALLYCWGLNSTFLEHGVLSGFEPGPLTPTNTRVFDLVALMPGHGSHFCGLNRAGAARCWGRNTNGQLGASTPFVTGSAFVPVTSSDPWSSIAVSRLTTCGVTVFRFAFCWGANQRGEGGTPTRNIGSSAAAPRGIENPEEYQSIAPGWLHTCALTTVGVAMCWGDNARGQLGLGNADTVAHRVPVAVNTTLRFQQLTSGSNYTCGVTIDNTAHCWGENTTGQLGDGSTINRATPTAVSTSVRFVRVYSSTGFGSGGNVPLPSNAQGGVAHTCGLTVNGAAYCWGWNGAGQLGDGTTTDRLTPVAVVGGRTFSELGLGGSHTCGKRNESISCWGGNQFGQLGNGTTTNSSSPASAGAPFNSN